MNNRLIFCDYLRGIAALCVLVGHFLYSFFIPDCMSHNAGVINMTVSNVDVPQMTHWILFNKYFPGFLGVFGVCVFFLISGFVISYSLDKKTFKEFWISRLFRLFPTYFVVMSMNLLIIALASFIYSNPFEYKTIDIVVNYFMGLPNLLLKYPVLDFVGWTLIIEMLFYVLISIANLKSKISLKSIFGIDLFCLTVIYLLRHFNVDFVNTSFAVRMFAMIPFMLLGVLVYMHYSKKINGRTFFWSLMMQFIFFLMLYYRHLGFIGWVEQDTFIYFFGLCLLMFLMFYKFNNELANIKILKFFGDVSYPLYLVHFYIGFFVIHYLIQLKVSYFLSGLIGLGGGLVIAHLVHIFVENPSNTLGKKIAKRMLKNGQ